MSQEKASLECPSCQHANEASADFCQSCRFPLVVIANKYRLERLLNEGGYSHVYLARHIRLKRNAERVIKIIKSESLQHDPTMEERFYREVQMTADLSLRCQHVVRVFDDFGDAPKLGHYYVMEYLQGMTIADLLERQTAPLPIEQVLHIFKQLCDAMSAAHQADIIHRDLKPANIMLTDYEGDPLYLKILDFGIAKSFAEEHAHSAQFTQGAIGTPAYMAPEHFTAGAIDNRADIYSMGILLFELLTGLPPFERKHMQQSAMIEMMEYHLRTPAPSLLEYRPEAPKALAEAIAKALNKQPEDRFQSAHEFKQALLSIPSSSTSNILLPSATPSTISPPPQDEKDTHVPSAPVNLPKPEPQKLNLRPSAILEGAQLTMDPSAEPLTLDDIEDDSLVTSSLTMDDIEDELSTTRPLTLDDVEEDSLVTPPPTPTSTSHADLAPPPPITPPTKKSTDEWAATPVTEVPDRIGGGAPTDTAIQPNPFLGPNSPLKNLPIEPPIEFLTTTLETDTSEPDKPTRQPQEPDEPLDTGSGELLSTTLSLDPDEKDITPKQETTSLSGVDAKETAQETAKFTPPPGKLEELAQTAYYNDVMGEIESRQKAIEEADKATDDTPDIPSTTEEYASSTETGTSPGTPAAGAPETGEEQHFFHPPPQPSQTGHDYAGIIGPDLYHRAVPDANEFSFPPKTATPSGIPQPSAPHPFGTSNSGSFPLASPSSSSLSSFPQPTPPENNPFAPPSSPPPVAKPAEQTTDPFAEYDSASPLPGNDPFANETPMVVGPPSSPNNTPILWMFIAGGILLLIAGFMMI